MDDVTHIESKYEAIIDTLKTKKARMETVLDSIRNEIDQEMNKGTNRMLGWIHVARRYLERVDDARLNDFETEERYRLYTDELKQYINLIHQRLADVTELRQLNNAIGINIRTLERELEEKNKRIEILETAMQRSPIVRRPAEQQATLTVNKPEEQEFEESENAEPAEEENSDEDINSNEIEDLTEEAPEPDSDEEVTKEKPKIQERKSKKKILPLEDEEIEIKPPENIPEMDKDFYNEKYYGKEYADAAKDRRKPTHLRKKKS